jgi:hypothetical protein
MADRQTEIEEIVKREREKGRETRLIMFYQLSLYPSFENSEGNITHTYTHIHTFKERGTLYS